MTIGGWYTAMVEKENVVPPFPGQFWRNRNRATKEKARSADRKAADADREAHKSDRLATKAIREVNKLTGSHVPDGIVSIMGDILGGGVNLALGGLEMAGIPGVSTAAGIAGALSGAFGFLKRPETMRAYLPNKSPQRHLVVGQESRGLANKAQGVQRDRTTLRSHFWPCLASATSSSTVSLAPDVQLTSFERGSDLTPDGAIHSESCRVFLAELPSTAVYGDIIASIPLDLLEDLLATTQAAYVARAYDLVIWAGAALGYMPTCAATTSGGMIAVSTPDPTRSLAVFSPGERVKRAFSYGDGMMASNLWSEGSVMKIQLDPERKYQTFKTSPDSDEALKLGAAGRVEVVCSGSWDTSGASPGMLFMDMEFLFIGQVPAAYSSTSVESAGGSCSFYDLTTVLRPFCDSFSDPITLSEFVNGPAASISAPTGFNESANGELMNFCISSGPTKKSVGGVNDMADPQFLNSGGCKGMGITGKGYPDGSFAFYFPAGSWYLMYTISFTGVGAQSPSTLQLIANVPGVTIDSSTVLDTFTAGARSMIVAQIEVESGSQGIVSLYRPKPTAMSAATVRMDIAWRISRKAGSSASRINPLIDNYTAKILRKFDRFASAELDNYVPDQQAYIRDQSSNPEASVPSSLMPINFGLKSDRKPVSEALLALANDDSGILTAQDKLKIHFLLKSSIDK
jgi:hypothetical protein